MIGGGGNLSGGDILEEYGDKEVTLKMIAMLHIKKISDIACQELSPGWWERKPVSVGGGVFMAEKYHPDLREAYCNAVNFLADLCYPDADGIFQKEYVDIENEIADAKRKANEIKMNRDDWLKIQLEYKRKIFQSLIVMFNRANYFGKSGFITQ